MPVLPMFPLGTVLFPGAVLPLHVFEPRYRRLVADCLEGEPEFGVVLIERGSEVGGGDVRNGVGTRARILEVAALPGGRYALTAVGTERIVVERWLIDDPYPRAEVVSWPDADASLVTADRLDEAAARVRNVLALTVELGEPASPLAEVSEDRALATQHLSAQAPLGPIDHQRLLAAPDPLTRLTLLDELLDGVEEVLRFRLGPPGAGSG